MRILAALLALTIAAQSQTPKPAPHPATPAPEQLKFTLILARHGVRPPTVANTSINPYAAEPWPTWEVAPGQLTPHGAQVLAELGTYMRLDLVEDGLLPPGGCPAPTDIYLYADTDQRNIDSTRATFAALAPNCPLDIDTMAPTTTNLRDPLFNPVPGTFPAPTGDPAKAALTAALRPSLDIALSARANPALTELAKILAPDPAHPAAKPILAQKIEFADGTYGLTTHGPLSAASNLVEDIELEFLDNKPLAQVAWGRLGTTDTQAEQTLRQLMPLHIKAFGLGLRTPLYAKAEGSNLLAHILATLDQAAEPQYIGAGPDGVLPPTANNPYAQSGAALHELVGNQAVIAIGPLGAKLVYLSGHDSNIASLGGLLNLHWTTDNHTDDTPPDSQLLFELWQRPGQKDYDIRIRYRAQTYTQIREATPLTLETPPAEVELTPTGCLPHHPCPLGVFTAAATKRLDSNFVLSTLQPTQRVR